MIGRSALVTGAGSGIGRATAAALLGQGMIVYGLDRDEDALHVASITAPRLRPIVCDLADLAAVDTLPQRHPEVADVDVLANIAGALSPSDLATGQPTDWDHTLAAMLAAPMHLAALVLPGMYARRRGVVINMGSVYAELGGDAKGGYVAAKHGLAGVTRQIILEGAPWGVRAFLVNAAHVESPLLDGQAEREGALLGVAPEVRRKQLAAQIPSGRFVTATEVAELITWLVTAAPPSLTGAISLDGGWLAGTASGLASTW